MGQSVYQASLVRKAGISAEELRIEVLRKGIHLLIAIVPTLAGVVGVRLTLVILAFGTIVYTLCETLRMAGKPVPVISRVTSLAARRRDAGKFVLGPVTLGIGAMLALTLYPNPAASVAIYSLAFGDGLSSLVGKLFGTIRLPFTGGKSLEGSLTCFLAVFVSAFALTGKALPSMVVAFLATITEAMPLKDLDNIILPFVAGGFAFMLL
jgi:dolichol kinase